MKILKSNILVTILISIIGIFYLVNIKEGHNWGDDFSIYIHHAKNIVKGIQYSNTGYIVNPFNSAIPGTYPPVFPFLLAPLYALFGLSFVAMKTEVIILFILALFTIYLTFRNTLPFQSLLLLIATISFNYYFLNFSANILSDLPFMFFLYLALFIIEKSYHFEKLKIWQNILYGFLIYLAYGTRSVGILILFSLVVLDIIKFKKITKSSTQIMIFFITLALLQHVFLYRDYSVIDKNLLSPKLISSNIVNYATSFFFFWYNGYSKVLHIFVFCLFSILSIIGFVVRIKERLTILEIFFVLYIISLIILPGYDPIRYILPIVPLYLFFAFWLTSRINYSKYGISANFIFFVLLFFILCSYVGGVFIKMDYGPIGERVTKKEAAELFNYIKINTGQKDVFIFSKARALALFTDRSASVYHLTSKDKDLWDYFRHINATYVIASRLFPSDRDFLFPFMERYQDKFQNVFANADFVLYTIKY